MSLVSKGFRPLPITIGAMALLVVIKLSALVQGSTAPAVLASAGRAVIPAAQASSAEEAKPAAHSAAKPSVAEAPPPSRVPPAAPPVAAAPTLPAVPPASEAEMALLQDLRSRRTKLDGREQTLETREAVLAAAERRLSERVEQLAAMQTRLETLDQTRRERDEANWRGLVKTYETMRPRDAAAIFNELDQPVLMQVLDRMKEAKTAPVLAAMLPERGAGGYDGACEMAQPGPGGSTAMNHVIVLILKQLSALLNWGLMALLILIAPSRAMAADSELASIAVRVGSHPGFGRVVFELPPDTTYELATEGGRLLLVFGSSLPVNQPVTLPRNVASLRTAPGSATLVIAAGSKARPARVGNRLVLDILDPAEKSPVAPDPAEAALDRPNTRAAVRPTAKAFQISPPTGDMRERQSEPAGLLADKPDRPIPSAVGLPAGGPGVGAGPKGAEPGGASGATGVAEKAPVIPVQAEDLAASSGTAKRDPAPVAALAAVRAEPVVIPADSSVGAASFRRGEFGLLVLDRRLSLEAPAGLDGATVVLGAVTSMVQVPLPPDRGLRTKRVPSGWSLEVVDAENGNIVPQPGKDGIKFPFAKPGRAVTVLDPVTGGLLLVGTSLASGSDAALASGANMPDYRLLPTWLGVAVEPIGDQVDLRPVASGFALTGSASAPMGPVAEIKGKRFDLPNEPAPALLNRLKAQLASAATSPPRGRTRDRMAAAQAYMALGMGVEAQALMQLVAVDDPQAAQDAQVSALGAVAAVMAGRLDEAGALDDPRLDGSDEIALWRGLRDRRAARETPAAMRLAALGPVAKAYPETLRRLVWPDVAEAAVLAGTLTADENLPPFAKALLLERMGKVDEALAAYTALQVGNDRLDQVRGTLNSAELRLASGRISPAETADILERQAFAWRGDAREVAIRLRAAELRAAAGGWRLALDSLRQTEALFPDQQAAIRTRKAAVFQSMLAAKGGSLTPLEVVLLAAEYADCVPEGQQGAGLAGLLAEKLATLDLPARAIPVLQGLVKGAPAGPARAEFGFRLGQLLLDGEDAAGALAALGASASANLQPALLEGRALLRAKATAAQGDLAGAILGLSELGTAAADNLRATLLASAGDWRGSLAALTDLAAKTVPAAGPLSEDAQGLLMRQASAAAQAEDTAMLRTLERSASRMTGARADLFRVLTAAPLAHASELPRAAQELKMARVVPQRLQDLGAR